MATDDLLARAQDYWFRECKDGREVRDRRYLGAGDLAAFAREEVARELVIQAQGFRVAAITLGELIGTGELVVFTSNAEQLEARAAALRKGE